MMTVTITGLMRISDNITMIFITCFNLYIQAAQVITAQNIIGIQTSTPFLWHPVNKDHTSRTSTIQASTRALDHFQGIEIIIAKLVKISTASGIGKRDAIPINLYIS